MLRLQTESRELAESRPLRNPQVTPTFPDTLFGRFLTLNSFWLLVLEVALADLCPLSGEWTRCHGWPISDELHTACTACTG